MLWYIAILSGFCKTKTKIITQANHKGYGQSLSTRKRVRVSHG